MLALAADPPRAEPSSASEVVVSGAARQRRGLGVVTLDEKDIERYGQTNVGETLERLPALHASGDDRGERNLSLRGFDQRGVVAMVDGVPLAVPYDGQIDLSKLPIDTVERITVVQGSTPLLYGPNGTGGAINVITREPGQRPSVRLLTEAAPAYAMRASGAASGRFGSDGSLGVLLGAAYENRRYTPLPDGFGAMPNERGTRRTNSDRVALSGTGKFVYDLDERNRFLVHIARFGGEFGVPPATRDFVVRNWRWSQWQANVFGVAHTHSNGALQIETHAYASLFDNTLDSYDNDLYRTQLRPKAFHSIYNDKALGGFLRTHLRVHKRVQMHTWTGLRHDVHTGVADYDAPAVTASTNLLTTSLSADVEILPKRVFATVAGQVDGELPNRPEVGPSAAPAAAASPMGSLGYQLGGFSFALSGAMRSRTPTLRERFSSSFGAREPNPTLGQERALDLSADAAYASRWIDVGASVFDSTVRGLVTEVAVGPGLTQLQNVSRARFFGTEGRIRLRPVRFLDLDAALIVLSAQRTDGEESRLAYKPGEKATLSATVRPFRGFSCTILGRVIGAQDFQNPNDNQWGRLPTYGLLDGRVDYQLTDELRVWLRATNLTGANVESRFSFPEAGRQVFVGFGSRFELGRR